MRWLPAGGIMDNYMQETGFELDLRGGADLGKWSKWKGIPDKVDGTEAGTYQGCMQNSK